MKHCNLQRSEDLPTSLLHQCLRMQQNVQKGMHLEVEEEEAERRRRREPHQTLSQSQKLCREWSSQGSQTKTDSPPSGKLVYATDSNVPVKQLRKEVTRGRCKPVIVSAYLGELGGQRWQGEPLLASPLEGFP